MGCCGTKEAPKGAIAAKPQKAVKAEDDKKYAVKNNRGEAAIPLDTIGTSDDVTVVYFPDDQAASPFNELDASAAVSKDGSLARILETIGDCEWKMELCVPSLTNPNLVVVLNAMSENGMRIRIITDDKFPTPPELSSAVQHQVFKKPNTPFEHSFAVLDDSSVLSGTYDWTEVSALTTHAACVSTKSRKVAARYVTEFDRLWEETGPNAESFNNNARSAVSRFDKKSNIFFFPDWGSSGNHDTASAILIKSMKKAKKICQACASKSAARRFSCCSHFPPRSCLRAHTAAL
eukprot:TRINITY_DN332_c2_g1_i2.p1 TRINITY_DN332_c2_g1~~TRINITY_DN332_c2_g1_i2.p1  ORF type:complete len:299 (+),score=48.68 TRINITY_DN332_c2_g1_i2:27-899(+)